MAYSRPQSAVLARRLDGPRRFIQVVAGPRQVGKTTLVQHVVERSNLPVQFGSADEPSLRGNAWIEQQWEIARMAARDSRGRRAILVLDEIQKISGWSETVKRLWDEDTRAKRHTKVVILGSAPLLIARGLSESLAGRFETIRLPHWTFAEMKAAFGWTVDQYVFYGGYPGSAPLVREPARWARYIVDSLIETTISRDVLLLTRVDKPAVLRRLFQLGCNYSGQVLSYTKMLGQLHDAGNTTTLSHYLDLLASAGMLTGLTKFAGSTARQRGSSPKFQVLNTALITAPSGLTLAQARRDHEYWGRLVESAVGAHLGNSAQMQECELYYWRDRGHEVDFVARAGRVVTAIEVKTGRARGAVVGLQAFATAFGTRRSLLVGGGGIEIGEFLGRPAVEWLRR